MLKDDPVQLNFYSKYSRAKEKQNINSLYHLIDNNAQNIKHIEQFTITVNRSRNGSLNNSPVRLLEEEPNKRSQLSVGKQKRGLFLEQYHHKERIAQLKRKKMEFLDEMFIHRTHIEQQIVKKKPMHKRKKSKPADHDNNIEEQISAKLFSSQKQAIICEGTNIDPNIQKPLTLMFSQLKPQQHCINKQVNTNEDTSNYPKLRDLSQNQQNEETLVKSVNEEVDNNYESIIIDRINFNGQLPTEQIRSGLNQNQLNHLQLQSEDIQSRSIGVDQNQQMNENISNDNRIAGQYFEPQKPSQSLHYQPENKGYVRTDLIQIPEDHLVDIPEQCSELKNEIDDQFQNKAKDVSDGPNSFKNVFYSHSPPLINLQQVRMVQPPVSKQIHFYPQQTQQPATNFQESSNCFNYAPLTLEVKPYKKQVKNDKRIIFKKLLVANKLHLNPRLATSTIFDELTNEVNQIFNERINEVISINHNNNNTENKSQPLINPKSPSPPRSKINFKSMLQKNRKSKSGSPDRLSPSKNGAKSSHNLKLLIGFFHQN